ncbi:signal peptidase I [Sphaerisporangium flaviroseum]
MSVTEDKPEPRDLDAAEAPALKGPEATGDRETVDPDSAPGAGPAASPSGADGAADPADPADPAGPSGKGKKSAWWESILLVSTGVVAVVLVHLFVLDSFYIPSESMERTLLINDRVIVNRLTGDLGRGEVVVFKGWDDTTTIKRVIGIGGDHVKCCDAKKRVTVNGVPIDEEAYLHPDDFPSQHKFDVTVPKGRLWLMGDHRAASEDSRAFMDNRFQGTISTDDVIGRAFALYWPLSRVGTLPVPETFSKVR